MSGSEAAGREQDEDEVPATDLCENCDREILPEVIKTTGRNELIHKARKADKGFEPVVAGTVTVRFNCQCSYVDVEYAPGSASAWDFPDVWMWENDFPEIYSADT